MGLVDLLVEESLGSRHGNFKYDLVHLPEQVFQLGVELLDDVG